MHKNQRRQLVGQVAAAQAQRRGAQARPGGGRQAPHHLRRLAGRTGQCGRQCALDTRAGGGQQRPVGGCQGQAAGLQQEVGEGGQGLRTLW